MEPSNHIAEKRLKIAWRCVLHPHRVPEELVAAMAEAVEWANAEVARLEWWYRLSQGPVR